MAYVLEADSHCLQIEAFINLAEKSVIELENIKRTLDTIKPKDESKSKKIKGTLKKLDEILTHFKKYGPIVSYIKLENDQWRKSVVIELLNFMGASDETGFIRHPTDTVDLDHVKWPVDSSTTAHDNF